MIKQMFLAVAVVMVTAVAAAPCRAEAVSAPRMMLEETSHDFGTVDEGSVLTHAFKVRNTGNRPLEIEKVTPT